MVATRDEAAALGARFVTVVIPSQAQVERRIVERFAAARRRKHGRERSPPELDLELPERHLEDWFHREGLAHVMLLAPLRESARRRRASAYLTNAHLDGPSHRLLGALLAARILPGAADLCHAPAGELVDVPALLGGPPLELDFTRHPHVALFGDGWERWTPPGLDPALAGWLLEGKGELLAHAGHVTLRGQVPSEAGLPARVFVARAESPYVALAEQSLDAAGSFTLRFELAGGAEDRWEPLCLRSFPALESAGPPGVILTSLRVD